MNARTRWLVIGAVVLLLTAGVVTVIVFGGDDAPGEQSANVATPGPGSDAPRTPTADLTADASGVTAAPAALTGTTPTAATSSTTRRRVAVKDTPAPPSDPIPTDPGDGLTPEQRKYLAETKKIVETNEADLREAAEQILTALIDRDEAALGDYLADDEGSQPDYVEYLADRYPEIVATLPGNTVNIFSVDGATVYFTYAVVRWEDAGIVSEHTISIPVRYVNGQWNLTTLDESSDLVFVQAVQL